MRIVLPPLAVLAAAVAAPALSQQVVACREVPPVTALVEPWEETTALLGEGAIRLALLEEEGGQGLLVLTLPTLEEVEMAAGAAEPGLPPPLPERRCRIVTEGGIGFAVLEVARIEASEDPEAATLTARVPALRFVPESSELEEVTLVLTFGVGDDSVLAVVEEPGAAEPEEAGAPRDPQEPEQEGDATDAP